MWGLILIGAVGWLVWQGSKQAKPTSKEPTNADIHAQGQIREGSSVEAAQIDGILGHPANELHQ